MYSLSSLAQFLTKLLGQAMMHLSIVGFPACGDCLRRVHINAMHCNVFPRPISSAMIHLIRGIRSRQHREGVNARDTQIGSQQLVRKHTETKTFEG